MIDNLDIDIESMECDANQLETSNGKASPSNKLVHQAEPEVAQQVPRSKPEILKRRKEQSLKHPNKNIKENRKRQRERTKSKYRAKSSLMNEQHNKTSSTDKEDRSEEIVDLVKDRENQPDRGDKLEFNKNIFIDLVWEVMDGMYKNDVDLKIKQKAVYFMQHLWEEYLIFWFSQLDKISQFAKHKTVMKTDFELYHMLINRVLNYDHLSFVAVIIKTSENSQIAEGSELPTLAQQDLSEKERNKQTELENKQC